MPKRIKKIAKPAIDAFGIEFKKQIITGITAAFAFLIALSWREPISESVNKFIEHFNLTERVLMFKFISAILVTIIAAIVLVLITRWATKPEKQEKIDESKK